MKAAGVGVEAGRQHEQVEVDVADGGADAGGRDRFDRRGADVDEVDVRLVEAVVEGLLERRSLGAERVGRVGRCEELGSKRVGDSWAHVVAPVLVGGQVRSLVDEGCR